MNINPRIRELLQIVLHFHPHILNSVEFNMSSQEIQSNISISPVPSELIDLYSFKINFCEDLPEYYCRLPIIPYYSLIPLCEINSCIDRYKIIFEKYSGTENFLGFQPDMIPFLNDGFGYDICIRSLEEDQSLWVMPKGDQPWKLNTSLNAFIETSIECYRQEAYYQEEDDYDELNDKKEVSMMWKVDWELAQEIARKTDPDLGCYNPP